MATCCSPELAHVLGTKPPHALLLLKALHATTKDIPRSNRQSLAQVPSDTVRRFWQCPEGTCRRAATWGFGVWTSTSSGLAAAIILERFEMWCPASAKAVLLTLARKTWAGRCPNVGGFVPVENVPSVQTLIQRM